MPRLTFLPQMVEAPWILPGSLALWQPPLPMITIRTFPTLGPLVVTLSIVDTAQDTARAKAGGVRAEERPQRWV
jgi:hypothetical protein